MAAKKPALAALKAVIKDFNSFMFEKGEGIPLTGKYDDLLEEIKDTAEEIKTADTLTEETIATLEALEIKHELSPAEEEVEEEEVEEVEEVIEKPKSKGKKKAAASAEEDEGDSNEDSGESESEPVKVDVSAPLKAVKRAKLDKLKEIAKEHGIRIPPPFYKDLAKLKSYLTEKLTDIGNGVVAAKKDAAKKKKRASTATKNTRPMVMGKVINSKKAKTVDDLISIVNKEWAENGGQDNMTETKALASKVLSMLESMGLLTVDESKKITYNLPA